MPRAAVPTLAELEKALTVAAYIVLRHGDVYAPIMERLEREVEDARRASPSGDRARRILSQLGRPALVPAARPA